MANSDQIYETLHSPFSIERHKKTFTAYLEAVMYEDGTVEYAVPSHQNKLIEICMKKLNLTDRKQLSDMCPPEWYADFTEWLCKISGCISIWFDFHMGKCNAIQESKLKEFQNHKIYIGPIKMREDE